MPKLFLHIELLDEYGQRIGSKAVPLDNDTAELGERIDRISPPQFGDTFDGVVHVLNVKRFRRQLFIREAQRLGEALADHLEDKEGWNGGRRQELIERAEREDR